MSKRSRSRAPGVTIKDIWNYYDDYNKRVNELTRQFAYAGIGTIWVFRVSSGSDSHIPHELFVSGLLLILSLSCEYLQAIVGSVLYQGYGSYKERSVKESESFQQPPMLLLPTDFLFFLKVIFLVAGFAFIIDYLAARLW